MPFPQPEADVLIVGTGMGGATLGYALARAGKKILFCEKGKASWNPSALRGAYAETLAEGSQERCASAQDVLGRAGRWSEQVEEGPSGRRFIPFLGSGTGGSTALYGMVLERLFPEDFAPRRYYPAPAETTLPEAWPIRYEELEPYYSLAERLYRVRGEANPCRTDARPSLAPPPVELSCAARELFDFFEGKGLHPYRIPSACEELPGCLGCQGFLCEKECKNDGVRICLEPALKQHGARLLEECEVLWIEADRSRVTGVTCRWRGRRITLRAETVVLAAGALETPRLLLDSAGPDWPNGLANDSGQVGRNLMRHYSDLYAVFPRMRRPSQGNRKEIALSDLYFCRGEKLGMLQSFGALPPPRLIVADLEKDLRDDGSRAKLWMFRLVKPLVKAFLEMLARRCVILASILEDPPLAENRVVPSGGPGEDGPRWRIEYRICETDRKRIATFRGQIRRVLRPYRFVLIKQAENNRRLAHICGTCRFGEDPATSVLDRDNRAHGIENLYVVDSSFFPSSGGANPALTIAANALRVADRLLERWAGKQVEVCEEALS